MRAFIDSQSARKLFPRLRNQRGESLVVSLTWESANNCRSFFFPSPIFCSGSFLFRVHCQPTVERSERGVEGGEERARKKAARGTAKGRKCDLSQNSRARCHLDDDCRFDRSPIDCVYLDLARCYYWDGISFTVRATRILELVEHRMMNSRKVV